MAAFTPDEQAAFLAELGLDTATETPPEVVSAPVAVTMPEPAADYERPSEASHLVAAVLDIVAGGANPRDPKATKQMADAIAGQVEFTGTEDKDEREVKCRAFFDGHKANRSDLPSATKAAYNSLLWRSVNEVAKRTKVTHQAKANAAAKETAVSGQTGLKEHIKQTNADNDAALAQSIADQAVSLLLAKLSPETLATVTKELG